MLVTRKRIIKLRKKRCSEASSFKVGSSLSLSNLEVSETISSIALL